MFVIWNRAYKKQFVVAEDAAEALRISQESGHTRRGYRKYKDVTDTFEDDDENPGDPGMLEIALNAGRSGVAVCDKGQGWRLNNIPTWE